jgi:hypothetical protein
LGTSSALDVSLVPEYAWIAQGATVDVPLSARVLSNGVPQAGNTVSFLVVKGSGALSSSSPTTDANGFARTTLYLSALTGDVQVSACASEGDQPCQIFFGTAVPFSGLRLQAVAGSQTNRRGPHEFSAGDRTGYGCIQPPGSSDWSRRGVSFGCDRAGTGFPADFNWRNHHHPEPGAGYRFFVTRIGRV